MFTATGLGEAHTWRLLPTRGFCLCAVQETLRAKEVAFRVSGDCSGAKMDAPVGMPGARACPQKEPHLLSKGTTHPGGHHLYLMVTCFA